MCCLFGIYDYSHSLTAAQKKRLVSALAVASEDRGTDATGIAYNHNGHLTVYKRPYPAHLMRFKLPDDSDAGPGTMQIELDNVDRALTQTIRDIHTPIPFKVEMVMDNAKDTVDLVWPEYVLVNIQYNAATISGTLTLDNLVREPFPGLMFTPGTAKGVFL